MQVAVHGILKRATCYRLMTRGLSALSLLVQLTACAVTGVVHEPPRVTSAARAVDVRIHRVVAGDDVTFTIDDTAIYRFGKTSYHDFAIDAGRYMFGYTQGNRKCHAEVILSSGNAYVFTLEPDCVIAMQ